MPNQNPRKRPGTPDLSRQERRVSALAEQDPFRFATSTAAEIAELTSTSEATVARAARKLGFSGTKEMKASCAARVDSSQSLGAVIRTRLESLPSGAFAPEQDTSHTVASAVLTSAADLLIRLNDTLEPALISHTAEAFVSARRVNVYGLGTAYRIAQYFCLELERVGVDALPLTGATHTAADSIPRIGPEDELVILAPLLIFPAVEHFTEIALERARSVTVISQDRLPQSLTDRVQHIQLPSTTAGAASESVTAWALCDVLIAEIARRNPERAIETRNYVQQLRERFSAY
ncbi:MurR/RpiR family transcriptional regulator [Nesterenkonia alkaliphila]|uniref:SIS domain-containing protein n=1 Tax=Nesterenkonia alkaliphila TaxID=1463631 RepID=A0A7K1UGI2_9MICC|nr:MurR/RpiR family transcriptional regulator [Nesterenkonia alkaliphila]MVT25575.1 hypothetical protein [Nesterenkonia alkaliphila]GFZ95099.1 hypothetical protein GCM10011359_25750 [Nesterenkonia alkaliphila]